ncbi:hypothetical protein N752_30905 [Desulforamulus aquiferis]|nr:HAMP domain-containing protein [Desulforamulus aquiferis]RYD01406.1 hypothetical protein N752_30905 [Desulforamulus aquiferis]
MKKIGIFIKVFIYTIIFSGLLVGATGVLFSTQIMAYYSGQQLREISGAFKQLIDRTPPGTADITELANQFHNRNQSFQFYITDTDNNIVYMTPGNESGNFDDFDTSSGKSDLLVYLYGGYSLHVVKDDIFSLRYGNLIERVLVMLSAMLAVCVIGAYIFARQITKPIKILTDNTSKMANLEEVPPAPERKDELGTLARDIHSMYEKLKETISKLEDEILRERELEETQRYFFSAASHELKTPIAATSVLLEGMLENVGDYKDHPKYLRECVKMMDTQSKTISEIWRLSALTTEKLYPFLKNWTSDRQ